MSLLFGLAARALGESRPVRAQQPRGRLAASHPDQATAGGIDSPRDTAPHQWTPTDDSSRMPASLSPEAGGPKHEPPTGAAIGAAITPRAAVRGTQRQGTLPPHREPARFHASETPSDPARRAAQDPSLHARTEALLPDPEPLLGPANALADATPQPRVDHANAVRRGRPPARAVAAAAPTEVHVSIGRVELTALPSPPPPRAGRPRASKNNGLGDYLRGSRGSA